MLLNNNFYNHIFLKPSFKSNEAVSKTNPEEFRDKSICGNDFHGNLRAYRQFKTASDRFKFANPDGDVFMSGDEWVGANEQKNIAIVRIMNMLGLTFAAPGNHNFDNKGSKGYSKMLDYANFKTLALNIQPKNPNDLKNYSLQDDIDAGRLASSMIVEKNGRKIGYIGLAPSDLFSRLSTQSKADATDIKVLNLKETEEALRKEIDKLEKQGVKIIKVISHMGSDTTKEIAQNVGGIDVIHDGHSHDRLDGLVEGKNLFKSPRGEWVIVTQAGKNGHEYTELDVVYDKEGRIIKAKNELKSLETLPESYAVKLMENISLGKPEQIGIIAQNVKSKPETVLEESPLSSFLSDAYMKYSNADLVLNNMGGIRSSLPAGTVTDRMISDLMPFYNDVHVYKLSEKDIIDVLNSAIEATKKYHRTGALQVSGMRYVIGKDDKVKEACLVKKDGTLEPLNVKNPSNDKFFKVAYNTYVAGGSEGLEKLNAPEKILYKCDRTETQMFIDYIKSFNNQPITIKEDGRIQKES